MKISWSYLAIVAISIGCVFSSCQSKVNKPSHNELDSTNTSVEEVDSADIIAEQKHTARIAVIAVFNNGYVYV